MKTSLRGSRVGCFSRHAARAAATSGRFCSAAQSVFFIAEPQTLQKPTDRRLPDFNASFSQRLLQIKQRRAWRLLDKLTNNSLVRGELRLAVTAEITRSKISCRSKTLHQLDHETHADAELTSSLHGAIFPPQPRQPRGREDHQNKVLPSRPASCPASTVNPVFADFGNPLPIPPTREPL